MRLDHLLSREFAFARALAEAHETERHSQVGLVLEKGQGYTDNRFVTDREEMFYDVALPLLSCPGKHFCITFAFWAFSSGG